MGLTKDYLRYIPAGNFNIISSSNCNAVFIILQGQIGRFIAVGACEHIIIWDLRLGEKAQVLPGEKAAVTSICASPNIRNLAAGYSDGTVSIYDLKSAEVISIFSGHHSEVTTLCYDSFGHKLASGSKDTDIIIWDTVAETGLYRFTGHKGPITKIAFISKENILISASKDSFIKFWDLNTQHCFKTITGHKTEVWGLALVRDGQYLVTGCGDNELRVYKLSLHNLNSENNNPVDHLTNILELATLDEGDDTTHPLQCLKTGTLLRGGRGRVISLVTDPSGQVLGCHGTDNLIELFYFCTEDEAQTRLNKRLKKERKMEKKMEIETDETKLNANLQISLRDEVKRFSAIKLTSKPKSLDLVLGNGGELRIAVNLRNNSVQLFNLQTVVKNMEAQCLRGILNHGHHSDIRCVAFSHENVALASGSGESIKLWNIPSQTCLKTVETGYVQCLTFVPGDKHVLVGLKDGLLLIIDVVVGDILEEIPAHTKELRTIVISPNMNGCVTGGSDQTVKFWQFDLIVDEKSESKVRILSLIHKQTLKLEDSVLCVKLSPNGKFIAVALLDSTIKIFFVDTLKFYLSLYGHKLPVQCMDISSDSTLLVTGSGDRNIKIWGMDFGDCHKSIFAHDDTITGLQFVKNTHYFFTCSKDGKVKQWDADSYNKIITLQGHTGEAFSLSVSPNGKYVISCGSDNVLRLYEKSDQIVVLQDEEEEERELQEELATGEQTVIPGQPGLNLPSKKTIGSEKATESILECLEVSEKYREQLAEHEALQAASTQILAPPVPPLLMQAFNVSTPGDFLLETVKKIRASDLEEALLILPFNSVCEILTMLPTLIATCDYTELGCKIAMFLLRLHHAPIIANKLLIPTLKKLEKVMQEEVNELRDLIGYNYYGLQFLQNEIESKEGIQLFRDATIEKKKGDKKRRKREKLKRSLVVMNS